MSRSRLLGAARQVALTVGAIVGTLCIVAALAAVVLDVRPLVFRSGSMSPTIGTGALAIAQRVDASSLEVGQVVSVPTQSGERVTHRIQAVEHQDGSAVLQLKGDANETPDATPYVVTHADRVVFSLPWLGYAVGWAAGPPGLFLLGLYAAFLLSVIVRSDQRPDEPPTDGDPPRPTHRAGRAAGRAAAASTALVVVSGTLAAGVLMQARTVPTLAAWADPTAVSGTTVSAYTVPAPDGSSCAAVTPGTGTDRGVNLTWPATAAPLPALSYTPTVSGLTGPTTNVATIGSNKQLQVHYNPGTAANQNKIVTVQATGYPTGTPSWLGAPTSWKFRTGANAGAQPTCGETVPPVADIRAPDGTTRTRAAFQTFLTGATGCTTTGIILCGTMSDASTIAAEYILQRTVGSTVRCWAGSWVTGCAAYQPASTGTYSGMDVFYEDGTTSSVYDTAGTYTLTVRLTDSWANVTTDTVTFTLT
ncbi:MULTISPECIES: signal peptidase I [unclassified Nocardioides]|uniref:signal peptidase I n=1 Tax=unclassified Nocardioides TaxID=2615069 RepID=UPI0009E6D540|nr:MULTISPECIES: signal peptidase I [unclassified Nocardioides]